MFPNQNPRPSAMKPISRAASLPRKVTEPDGQEAEFLSWTLPDVDREFADFLDYAEFGLGHSPDTRRGYKGTYGSFRSFLVDGLPADLARRLFAIEEWLIWNRKRGVSQVTLNTYFRQLRPFFRRLCDRFGFPDPYQGLTAPPLPAIIPKARSAEECRHILLSAENYPWDSAYERWRAVALIGVMLFAGLRKGEVLRLRYADVDLREETIRINRGKGRHGGKDRVVMVAPDLRRILQNFVRERTRRGLTGPGFFASMRTGQPISESTLKRVVEAVRRASGIRFSIHSLRHSFVTALLKAGVPLHVARDLCGHASITTTAGYLRVFDDDKRDGVRRLRFD